MSVSIKKINRNSQTDDQTGIDSRKKSIFTNADSQRKSDRAFPPNYCKNPKSEKFREKYVRRINRKKRQQSVKSEGSELPCVPEKVLRVLEILRHEKFLDLVEEYFKPFENGDGEFKRSSEPTVDKPEPNAFVDKNEMEHQTPKQDTKS